MNCENSIDAIPPICIMTCGCRVEFENLVELKKVKCCPNHSDGRILRKEFTCIRCGEKFETGKCVASAKYCDFCKVIRKNETNRKCYRGIKNPVKKKTKKEYVEASVDMAFCKKRRECTRKYVGDYMPCLDCEHYKDPEMINSL